MSTLRVVVVGYGMAGARLVERLRQRAPDPDRVEITVLGDEKVPAYNRVLLTNVLSGSLTAESIRLHDDGWAARNRIDLKLGVGVATIDRTSRTVTTTDGTRVRYDALVIATGSRPWLPPTEGLHTGAGELADGVVAYRTLADCELVMRRARPGTALAVVGGGLLGLELARALSERVGSVTVVHPMGWILERQLDADSSRILAKSLEAHGIRFRLGRLASRYVPGAGLTLDDGSQVAAGLVVVAAGARAETGLASQAGLTIKDGIVVDDCLRTSDPHIFAIGDCAQHAGAPSGFVEPAWAQAGVLADLLTGADPGTRYAGTRTVTRLKARGVDLTSLGDAHVDRHSPDHEVLCLLDSTRGRYAKVVLREGAVHGAILLGFPDAAARIAQYFDEGAGVPSDRLALLLGRALPDEPAAADRVVCRCNNVTAAAVVESWRRGAGSIDDLITATRATTGCGTCLETIRTMTVRLAAAQALST